MTNYTIGIDISKEQLDVHRCSDNQERTFPNDRKGLQKLIEWLAQDHVDLVAFEATGPYHRALEETLADAQLPAVKVNPRHARRFAEATGTLAKTDRIDARILAQMAACVGLEPRPANTKTINELKELHIARAGLMKERTATINRGKLLTLDLLKKQNKQRRAQIEKQIDTIEMEIARLFECDPVLKRRLDILKTIPGIAEISAFTILIEMPELGTLDPKQAASLAGLAPITRQSGKWRGKSFIRGGRRHLRHALYMPALVATRHNPELTAKYKALIEAGKPPKLALTAIMRKLLILANALLRDDREWAKLRA